MVVQKQVKFLSISNIFLSSRNLWFQQGDLFFRFPLNFGQLSWSKRLFQDNQLVFFSCLFRSALSAKSFFRRILSYTS